MKVKKLLLISIIYVIMLGTLAGCTSDEDKKVNTNNVITTQDDERLYETMENYEFIPDDEVLGKWQYVDFIENIEDFDPANIKTPFTGLETFEFFEDGTSLMNDAVHDKWTKGYVIRQINSVVPAYTMKQIDGTNYMFFEWKDNENYFIHGKKPPYYVFQKTSD